MEESKNVFDLCYSVEDKSVELEEFLENHPDVDVNLFQHVNGGRSIHAAAYRGHGAYLRLLIKANADLEMRDNAGFTAVHLASSNGNLNCLQILIESKADVNAATDKGTTSGHGAAYVGHSNCLHLLINAKADVNARSVHGVTPAMYACQEDRLTCLQLLVDAKADLNAEVNDVNGGVNTMYFLMAIPKEERAHRVPGMPFAVLSCNTDSKIVIINDYITRATVDPHIDEYKQVQAFIDERHSVTKHALSRDVVVDTRVGLGDNGIYQEPLEQVLLYLGLSMDKNQTVNVSIDGATVKRALIPGHPTNANLWFELYQQRPR
jgi:hypothetical protein